MLSYETMGLSCMNNRMKFMVMATHRRIGICSVFWAEGHIFTLSEVRFRTSNFWVVRLVWLCKYAGICLVIGEQTRTRSRKETNEIKYMEKTARLIAFAQ
jgi:hypothetical protein